MPTYVSKLVFFKGETSTVFAVYCLNISLTMQKLKPAN